MKKIWTPKHSALPTRIKGVLGQGLPSPETFVCRKFTGECSQYHPPGGSEVSKNGQREKLNCNTITIKALAGLSGRFGAGIAKSFPKLG